MWIPKTLSENENQRSARVANVVFSNGEKMSVSGEESFDNIHKIVPYGFDYSPPVGATAVIFPVGNSQLCGGVFLQNNIKLQPGEVALYSLGGANIVLKNDGTVVINGKVFEAEGE